MNPYFPLLGLAMFVGFGLAISKFAEYLARKTREEQERQRKEAEAARQPPH